MPVAIIGAGPVGATLGSSLPRALDKQRRIALSVFVR
jgi:2-polyprenyl-6-methoxyphenol hydroxylase-like FAD-dependent oxidoreductase